MLGLLPDDVGLLVAASDPRLSPDGAHVAFTVRRVNLEANRYESRIWLAAVDGTEPARAFTPETTSAGLARWSPDGARIAYTAHALDDDDDDVMTEVHVAALAGGEPSVVCACPSGPSELEWSPDGTRVAFVAREPDPERYGTPGNRRKERDMPPRRVERLMTRLDSAGWISDRPNRVFVVAVDGSEQPRSITPGAHDASDASWSPDGRRIAFASARHDTWDVDWFLDIFVADAESGALQRVTATSQIYSQPTWSPDGSRLACVVMPPELEGPWHSKIAILDLERKTEALITGSFDRNCVSYPSPRGPVWEHDRVLFFVEDGGTAQVWRVDPNDPEARQPVVADDRVVSGLDSRAGTVAFTASSPTLMPELFVLRDGTERKLTDLTAELAAADRTIAVPEAFSASPAAGVEVDCWIIEPEHAPGARVPLLLNIHGGPFTQYSPRFFDEFQYEVGAGFGVLFCNPRGSSGYSEAWGRAIRWPECKVDPGSGWGGVDYDDIMACVDEAVRRYDWIDPDRIGVIGGSYGGYMTSWIIGHSKRFAAAISERSCNNLLTLDHGSDIAGAFAGYVGVSHVDDPEPYLRHSPISYVRDMTTPLLILHSENDLRCPVNQAEELFVALRLLDRTPEFVRFPGESHELTRSGAPLHRSQRAAVVIDFFRRHLLS